MVKCSNCGVNVPETSEFCPNCGNDLSNDVKEVSDALKCSNCGAQVKDGNSFCSSCGTKIEIEESISLKCENCGSALPENTLFCSTCGAKVTAVKKSNKKICPNCGVEVDESDTFCDECGANIYTGEKNNSELSSSSSFVEKINLNVLIKPSIIALVFSLILSFIGLLLGFSWFSFIINDARILWPLLGRGWIASWGVGVFIMC